MKVAAVVDGELRAVTYQGVKMLSRLVLDTHDSPKGGDRKHSKGRHAARQERQTPGPPPPVIDDLLIIGILSSCPEKKLPCAAI